MWPRSQPKVHRVGLPAKSAPVGAKSRTGVTANVPLTAGSWNSGVRPASYVALTASTNEAIRPASVTRSPQPSRTTGSRAAGKDPVPPTVRTLTAGPCTGATPEVTAQSPESVPRAAMCADARRPGRPWSDREVGERLQQQRALAVGQFGQDG